MNHIAPETGGTLGYGASGAGRCTRTEVVYVFGRDSSVKLKNNHTHTHIHTPKLILYYTLPNTYLSPTLEDCRVGKQGNLDVGTLGTAEEMDTILRKKKKN